MTKLKRVLIFIFIFVLLALNGMAIHYAVNPPNENGGVIIVICIAVTCVLSVFTEFILKYLKRKKNN